MLSSPICVADVSTKTNKAQILTKEPLNSHRLHQLCSAWKQSGLVSSSQSWGPDSVCLCIVNVGAARNCHGKLMAGRSKAKEGLPPSPELNAQGQFKTCLSGKLPYCRNFCFEWKKHLFNLGEGWLLKVADKNMFDPLNSFIVLVMLFCKT